MSAALALALAPIAPTGSSTPDDDRTRLAIPRTDRPPLPASMASRPGVPFVFEDNREILQGPQIVLLLYSTPEAARRQQDRLDINSSVHRRQNRPRSPLPLPETPLPHEVDGATRVVRLAGMVSSDDLRDDVSYKELLEDITGEVCKYGDLLEVVIPRPRNSAVSPGVGKVFLKYACLNDSIRCRMRLDGRWFSGRMVVPEYYPEDRFAAGDYGYDG